MFFQTFLIANLPVRSESLSSTFFHPLHFLLQPPHLNIKSILPNKYIYIYIYIYIYSCYHSFYSSNFFLIQNSSFMILLRVCISFPLPSSEKGTNAIQDISFHLFLTCTTEIIRNIFFTVKREEPSSITENEIVAQMWLYVALLRISRLFGVVNFLSVKMKFLSISSDAICS